MVGTWSNIGLSGGSVLMPRVGHHVKAIEKTKITMDTNTCVSRILTNTNGKTAEALTEYPKDASS